MVSMTTDTLAVPSYALISRGDCALEPELDWAWRCARHLLDSQSGDAVMAVLAELGALAGVCRAWRIEYSADLQRLRVSHEWCRDGVASNMGELQDTPVAMSEWIHRLLHGGHCVAIHDVGALPREGRSFQGELTRQGIVSCLNVPFFYQGRLSGNIGFDMTRNCHRWQLPHVKALFQVGELIGLAEGGRTWKNSEEILKPLIYLRYRSGARGVALDEIVGLRSAKDYSEVLLVNGSRVLDFRPLATWCSLLPESGFMRIHRTAIVNLSHVTNLIRRSSGEAWHVELRSAEGHWPVARQYRQDLRARLFV